MAKKRGGGRNGAAVILDLPVHYSNVNVGDATASVSVTISRSSLPIGTADKQLCGRRLTGTIIAKPAGSEPDQEALTGMNDDLALTSTFDVKRIGIDRKTIKAPLTFSLSEIEVSELAKFAKRAGRLRIESSEAIPEDEGDDEEEENDEAEAAKHEEKEFSGKE